MAKKSSAKSSAERETGELAERMLRVLESQRPLGGDAYPPTLGRLAELSGVNASNPLVIKAANKSAFKNQAVVAWNENRNPSRKAPVFLASPEDLDSAVAEVAPTVLLALFKDAVETNKTPALSLADWGKKLTGKIQKPFKDAIQEGLKEISLPPEIGWLKARSSMLLFPMSAVRSSGPRPPVTSNGPGSPALQPRREPAAAGATAASPTARAATPGGAGIEAEAGPSDFATAFREAFDRLDRANRSTNFVRLLDLRRALPQFDRQAFDAGLTQLRRAREFTLDSHEGRHGPLTEEEIDAGVHESGSLLAYVSRRS